MSFIWTLTSASTLAFVYTLWPIYTWDGQLVFECEQTIINGTYDYNMAQRPQVLIAHSTDALSCDEEFSASSKVYMESWMKSDELSMKYSAKNIQNKKKTFLEGPAIHVLLDLQNSWNVSRLVLKNAAN